MQKILVNAIDAASLLDVRERTFHNLRKRADFVAKCPEVRLSARAVKWRVADLEAFARSIATTERAPEPPQFARARAKREQANAAGR